MFRRYGTAARTFSPNDAEFRFLIYRQVEIFERIATRLDSIDERLGRMAAALEDARNISGQPF